MTFGEGGGTMRPGVARAVWRVLEPLHEICYSSEEAVAEMEAIGLDRWDLRYFGSRAAALGLVSPALVTSLFFGFEPRLVERAIPQAWERADPATILRARLRGASAALRRILKEHCDARPMQQAAALARTAALAVDTVGRPMAAALAALPWPEAPHEVLWHAATLLREHRGDGHVAALVTSQLDGVTAHVLHGADGAMPATTLQRISGWSDEAWARGIAHLQDRGLLDIEGNINEAGQALKDSIEHRTDRLAMAPFRRLGAADTERLRSIGATYVPRLIDSGAINTWRVREQLWRDFPDQRGATRVTSEAGPGADLLDETPAVDKVRVVVVTKGHPFDPEPFFDMFRANTEIEWSHAEHPAAQGLFHPSAAEDIDVFVLYDMPGIRFQRGISPRFPLPPERFASGFHRLLDAGKGFVFLHHAIAGWPGWPEYREIIGGQFLYAPGELRGRRYPDSGYRHDVTHTVRVVDKFHPVVEGLPPSFELTDEVYLCPVFEQSVVPLLRSDHEFVDRNFYSSSLAVIEGRMFDNTGWRHPRGSNLVAWAKRYSRAPIVYLQPGDGVSAYTNEHYRRLLGNAIRWVATPEARAWAAEG